MNKKKVLPGLVVLTAALLTSCGEEEYVDPYAVELNKPMMFADEDPHDAIFSWTPVAGADGYLIKVDGAEQVGIGNPVFDSGEGVKICYYVLNTDSLEEGDHKVQFAAYSKEKVSEWTDVFSVKVKKESLVKLSRPTLSNDLNLTSVNDDIDQVEFDFGNGVVATCPITDFTVVDRYDGISIVGNPEILGIADKLEYGTTYVVTARTGRKGVFSEKSNPVSYTFSSKYYNEIAAPTIIEDEVLFEETLVNPNLTVKINDKEYTLTFSSNIKSITLSQILGNLYREELITGADVYSKNSLEWSVKVNFDNNHYKASEYSNTVTILNSLVDEEIAEYIFDSVICTSNKNEVSATLPSNAEFEDFVKVTAKVDEKDATFKTYESTIQYNPEPANPESRPVTIPVYKFSLTTEAGAKQVVFTVTYTRGEFTKTKDFVVELSQLENVKIGSLRVDGSVLQWGVIGTATIDQKYIVEIKSGETVSSFETSIPQFDLKDIDVAGKFTVKVYAMSNDAKLESSVSDELSLDRLNAPSSTLNVSNGSCTVGENQKLLCYKNIKGIEYLFQEVSGTDENTTVGEILSYDRLELIQLGDGITKIDSKPRVFEIKGEDASNLVYTVEDAKYIVLKDYKWVDLLNYEDQKYIVKDENGNKFDMAKYYDETGYSQLNIGKTNITLSSDKTNVVLAGSLSFDFAPSVTIKSSSKATSSITWAPRSTYYGNYEVLVEKFDEKTKEYVKDTTLSKDSVSDTSFSMANAAVGKYHISIRALGNGNVLAGSYTTATYLANENKVEIDSVQVVDGVTHVILKNDFNLRIKYVLVNADTVEEYYTTAYDNDINLTSMDYTSLKIKTENNSSAFVRYLPKATFTISNVKIEPGFGSVKIVNNITPEIPYGMGSSTIYAPYLYEVTNTWMYAKTEGTFIVKENKTQVTDDAGVTTEKVEQFGIDFIVVNVDLGYFNLDPSLYVGSPSYTATKVVVQKDKPLLEQLQKAVRFDVSDKELKTLVWKTVDEAGKETTLDATISATETVNLKVVKENPATTYAYNGGVIVGAASDYELKVFADETITIGGNTIYGAKIKNNVLTYSNNGQTAYYKLDTTNKTYAPLAPEGTGTEYVANEEYLKTLKEEVENLSGPNAAEAQESIENLIKLLEKTKFYTYDDYLVVKVDGKHTVTYEYDGTSGEASTTIIYGEASYVLSHEDHTFIII